MANPYQDLVDNPYEDLVTGEIPNTENFLQKAIRSANPIPRMQMAADTMGDFAHGFMDTSSLGATALAKNKINQFTDSTLNQAFNMPDYERPEEGIGPAYGVGATVPALAGAAALGKGMVGNVFKRQIANAKLPGASKKLTESIQEVIKRSKANPEEFGVDKNKLIKIIEDQFLKSSNPAGREATVFRTWLKTLKGTEKAPSSIAQRVTADILSEMEQQFGKASAFSTKPSNPILAHGARQVRNLVSTELDELAKRAGVPEFISRSTDKSKILSNIKANPSVLEAIFPAVRRVKNVIGDRAKGVLKHF